MLQRTDVITVGKQRPQADTVSSSCELTIDGRPTGQRVKGCVLEAAFQYNASYLAFLTHDCPFEETLSIYLINRLGKVMDSANLFWMYCTGNFSNVQTHQPDKISFDFFDRAKDKEGTRWTLQVLPRPSFRMPLLFDPSGVFRPFGLKRHFLLTANPRPSPL